MRLICPTCAAGYDVADQAIGPHGRKVRCRACGTSWFEPPHPPSGVDPVAAAAAPPPAPPSSAIPPVSVAAETAGEAAPDPADPVEAPRRRLRAPLLVLALVVLAVVLGAAAATILWGPQQVASGLGLAPRRVPLGIEITRQPDWRTIAGGSQLFAVSGRVWNPTDAVQPVPDIRAELKDAQGRTVYAWTISRPVPRLAPHASAQFDGAAVDVPTTSSRIAVSFAGTGER